jgi:hypothetical protein
MNTNEHESRSFHLCSFVFIRGLIFLSLASCGTQPPASTPIQESPAPRILQFYAAPGQIQPGEDTSICYGVENARAVRVEPEIEKLNPALSRCFKAKPASDTGYTLYVEGTDGSTTSKTTQVLVRQGPPPPPHVLLFEASAKEIQAGESVTICFRTENSRETRLDPPVQPLGAAQFGCFAVFPRQTTKYTLTALGAGKSDRQSLVVTIR